MNILFIGDVYGASGAEYLMEKINFLKNKYKPDLVVANTENVDNGKGLDFKNYYDLVISGVDLMTMGNHTWGNSFLSSFIDKTDIIRPINLDKKLSSSGSGFKILKRKNQKILIMNALGRVFMNNNNLSCPFKQVEKILNNYHQQYDYSLLDFHAQATSEKLALAHYFDGKIDAIVGTHTHIQTNDDRILPHNTLYISDVGLTGPSEGVIGQDKNIIIHNFLNVNNKIKHKISSGKRQINGVFLNLGNKKRKITKITLKE
ncbi:TIGR00282 family metallophosphoesterase [Candidatus Phytoplasma pini]|uniref:Putative metallophosphoesterase n=1 Tax=Candidatus Phytoplasma pini TaxID=267362 RepID=A0A559KJA0_9MOLU|nr:TIGR00282 family metallophosphoesterase [Candidatus Phytoplasma pini]TVY12212.1 putative metallophosphoesterase [Candidatus Phytoplasma pini]